jgi:hypothetical protein
MWHQIFKDSLNIARMLLVYQETTQVPGAPFKLRLGGDFLPGTRQRRRFLC